MIVGILPVGGLGTRLGMPFPKVLAPTFTSAGIEPLYAHAFDRLRVVSDRIRFVLNADDSTLADLPGERVLNSGAGLAAAVRDGAAGLDPDVLCAVALPDSMWWPRTGFRFLVDTYRQEQPIDGALALFDGSSHVLDTVTVGQDGIVTSITRHDDPPAVARYVRGWGALVASAGCLRGLTDDRSLAAQLAEYRFAAVHLGPHYYDLGTPQRYRANISRSLEMDQ